MGSSLSYQLKQYRLDVVDHGPLCHPHLVISRADRSCLEGSDIGMIEEIGDKFRRGDPRGSKLGDLDPMLRRLAVRPTRIMDLMIVGPSCADPRSQIECMKATLSGLGAVEVPAPTKGPAR